MDGVKSPVLYLMWGGGGAGHKSSADALSYLLQKTHPDWTVHLANASEVIGAAFGDDIYNMLLQKNLTSLMPIVYSVAGTVHPYLTSIHRSKVEEFFKESPHIDIVVSFVPFSNTAFCTGLPNAKHLTVLTDFASSDAHPWIQHRDQIICCGTEVSYEQAKEFFSNEMIQSEDISSRVIKTSGMVVHPKFYEIVCESELERLRKDYDLDKDLCTCLVLFGGYPPTELVLDIVKALNERARFNAERVAEEVVKKLGWNKDVNVIVVCGKNLELYEALCAMKLKRVRALQFTDQVPCLMQMSDVIIGKTGPACVAEACVSKKPVFVYSDPSRVMEQERDVLDFVRRTGIGKGFGSVSELTRFSSEDIALYKKNVDALQPNRAIFELQSILESFVEQRKELQNSD
mmetsp:Transcript_3935/g.6879  ORF Transcript_3935/g.6879 Transcript_3935/m.6879 type:complete len:402 (-) Transcript_3935:1569-2774(-)|eukprot:CAMPEP_0182447288 /NCGR_PEP_ID=MMETSP1172-20130603/14111_1 /TAXON_ID=708627 /ORGANISM="Timspurckia oligopyrenoides, Strain CCMP3278" /LENGTH=401 /DNA_ID=CAMNT_0024643671 /DNA_START=32 /DNA_END=1237 /DNA_ORIENTATION=-